MKRKGIISAHGDTSVVAYQHRNKGDKVMTEGITHDG